MSDTQFILTKTLCSHYHIEVSFIDSLHQMGLIEIEMIDQDYYVHTNQLSQLEKVIRLHNDLQMNLESIDIVFHLLEKERHLRDEVISLKNKLRLYESL